MSLAVSIQLVNLEYFLWGTIPILINISLMLSIRKKLSLPPGRYLLCWLLVVELLGSLLGPKCMCSDYTEALVSTFGAALVYGGLMFFIYVLYKLWGKKFYKT